MTRADNFAVFTPLIIFCLAYGVGEALRAYFYWRRKMRRG